MERDSLLDAIILRGLSEFINTRRNEIPIIDTIEVNEFILGRFDIVINKYYGGLVGFETLPAFHALLLDFNNISDPTDVHEGMFLDIPDFESLTLATSQIDLTNIPGVSHTTNSEVINREQKLEEKKDSTIGAPKINQRNKKASYDPKTGIFRF